MTALAGILITTYLAAVAETALAPVLTIHQVTPNLLALAAIVWLVSAAPSPWRIVEAAAIGLVFDFNSGSHAGVGMASFSLLAFAILHARPIMRRLGPVEQSLACLPAVAALTLIVSFANRLFGHTVPPLSLVMLQAFGCGVYTAAIGLPVWMILDWRRDARRTRPAIAKL
jgi:rod shape-determining protein MreD